MRPMDGVKVIFMGKWKGDPTPGHLTREAGAGFQVHMSEKESLSLWKTDTVEAVKCTSLRICIHR